jgi:hypothetical protein
MLIQEQALTHWIDYFYGYGSWKAPVWFIAYEESGGDVPEDVADRINYFSKVHTNPEPALCDIRELYNAIEARLSGPRANKFTTLFDHRFGKQAIIHGGWKNLIAFVHGYRNKKIPDLLAYQKKYFASASAQEALINLYPLPSPHNHAWYYSWLDLPGLSYSRNRFLYEETVYEKRIRMLLQKIDLHKPDVVLMYGMNNINSLKKSIQASFKTYKAIKQQIPQHHCADFNETTLIITSQVPTLRHNRIETGFDWYSFGKMVQAGLYRKN